LYPRVGFIATDLSWSAEQISLDFVEGLVRENESELGAYFRRRLPSVYDSADACQEVFLRMCRVDRPNRIRNRRAFLFRTAHNIVQDYYRKRHITEVSLEATANEWEAKSSSVSPERVLYTKEWWKAYCVAINELTPRCRRVFIMCRMQNFSHADIARELGISKKMVEKYMTKALAHFAVRLEEFLENDFF